jgi:hypothetical protein
MKKRRYELSVFVGAGLMCVFGLTGCGTVGSTAADLGLAGAGGLAGYQISGGKIGGAAAGATVGYLASKVTQSEVQKGQAEAEKRGFDRAMNQAVKQQYWIIQNQQHSRETPPESESRLVPVAIPETKISGVLVAAHVEYLRIQP